MAVPDADFYIKQHSTNQTMIAKLIDDRAAVVDLTGCSVGFRLYDKSKNLIFESAASILDPPNAGRVSYSCDDDRLKALSGIFYFDFNVTFSHGEQDAFPNTKYLRLWITA